MADRPPPTNLDAEAAVLSSVLINSAGCLDEVRAMLPIESFYSQANKLVFEAALVCADAQTAVDPVTVMNHLRDTGKLDQAGGAKYLYQLVDGTPAVANVMSHARIVRDMWRVRKAIALGLELSAEARSGSLGGSDDIQKWLESAESKFSDLAHETQAAKLRRLQDVIADVHTELTAAQKRGGAISGVPTGFVELDKKTSGMQDGDMLIVAGRPGMGKAQPFSARVLTPDGWKRMGDLKEGDRVVAADGRAVPVLAIYDRGVRDVFRLTFDDGATTECCDEHLWLTRTRSDRRAGRSGTVRSLCEIRQSLRRGDGANNHSIPFAAAATLRCVGSREVAPYLLGLYLGDGHGETCVYLTNPEPDLRVRFTDLLPTEDEAVSVSNVQLRIRAKKRGQHPVLIGQLRSLGLLGCRAYEKFIPEEYLLAPKKDRVALLQGLCDSDGYVTDPHGKSVEYVTTSRRLRSDICFLVGSLGGYATWVRKRTHYTTRDGQRHGARIAYRMILSFPNANVRPVSSLKHLKKWRGDDPHRRRERFIVSVRKSRRAACRCIVIDHPSHLYVTDDFVVTHNSAIATNIAQRVAAAGYAVALFSLEMPVQQLGQRFLSSETGIDLQRMREGKLQNAEWSSIAAAMTTLAALPVFLDDTPALSVFDLRARTRRLQNEIAQGKHPLATQNRVGLVVVDYLQLMTSPVAGDRVPREQQVAAISRTLKQVAKQLAVPLLVVSQLNRQPEQRQDKRPQLSDLRESGALEMDADAVFFLFRPEYYDRKNDPALKGWAELIIEKQRNGPTGTIKLAFKNSCTKFDNFASEDYDFYDPKDDAASYQPPPPPQLPQQRGLFGEKDDDDD